MASVCPRNTVVWCGDLVACVQPLSESSFCIWFVLLFFGFLGFLGGEESGDLGSLLVTCVDLRFWYQSPAPHLIAFGIRRCWGKNSGSPK